MKESYIPDRTTISALCFGRSRDYIFDESVGEYLGDIFVYNGQYMYYNHNKWWIARMLTDEQIELLQEYL